jgi:ATP-dependent DNA ligase
MEDAIAEANLIYPALRLEADRLMAWDQVKRGGWEGLVAKDEQSAYVSRRTRSWIKVKIRREEKFVVVGVDVPLAGSCSLLLATRLGRRLIYIGRVEWGVSRRIVVAIRESCGPRLTPACQGADTARGIVLG